MHRGASRLLNVRRNVVEMLRYMRRRTAERYLWIDAICINQADAGEKGTQVSMMGDIYADASRVLIWLGPPSFTTPEPDILYKPYPDAEDIQALQRFIRRRWFQRRWVIQKVLHARTALAVCGNYSTTFSEIVHRLTDRLKRGLYGERPFMGGDETMKKLIYVVSLREEKVTRGMLSKTNMATLLSRFHTADCIDARDRLYALNSFSSIPIPVDHALSAEELYYQYACAELLRCPVSLLSCAGALRPGLAVSSSSWIPDWRLPFTYTTLPSSFANPPQSLEHDKFVSIRGTSIVVGALQAQSRKYMTLTCTHTLRFISLSIFLRHIANQERPLGSHVSNLLSPMFLLQAYGSRHNGGLLPNAPQWAGKLSLLWTAELAFSRIRTILASARD
jgi:hypothetical protein